MTSEEDKTPYIVLVGDCGTGKSTVVEKLTGEKGRSSKAFESFTKTSEPFVVPGSSLIISDTPGSNSRKEKLQHNVWIAGALNFKPVSKVFIVVKADDRIDTTVDNVQKYADCFLELPMDVAGVLVTHMDMVEWNEEDFREAVQEDLSIHTVVFSCISTSKETLLDNILKTCKDKPHNLTVDGENFFKLFKIHSHHRKILEDTSNEVARFRAMKSAFNKEREAYGEKDQVDLIFEFQAYMKDEITRAEKRLSERNNFTFIGAKAENEAGHVANMANQLRTILYEIRIECLSYQADQTESELRRCTHCSCVWAKVEGCINTTCGQRLTDSRDLRSSEYGVLATYSFSWSGKVLGITKHGQRNLTSYNVSDMMAKEKTKTYEEGKGPQGCGRSINWDEMPKADVPEEFRTTEQISTRDIKVLPDTAASFEEKLSEMITSAGKDMKLGSRP